MINMARPAAVDAFARAPLPKRFCNLDRLLHARQNAWMRGTACKLIERLFGVTIRQTAINDLNLQPRKTHGRPGCIVVVMLVRQASSPSESRNRRGSNTPVIEG
jgi:hypothetical protein